MPGAYEARGMAPRHPNAYHPWGFGARACVGQLFALWEAKTFLCMLLPRFKLRLPPGFEPRATVREGGATPLCAGLKFYVAPRPNAPATSAPAAAAAAAAAGAAGAPALAHQWGGLPPAVPLRCLALALAYQDSGLGLAAAAAHAAALRQGAGAGLHGPPGLYACSDCCSAGTNAPPCPAHPT